MLETDLLRMYLIQVFIRREGVYLRGISHLLNSVARLRDSFDRAQTNHWLSGVFFFGHHSQLL